MSQFQLAWCRLAVPTKHTNSRWFFRYQCPALLLVPARCPMTLMTILSVIQGAGGLVPGILFLQWSLQRASGIVPRLYEHARLIQYSSGSCRLLISRSCRCVSIAAGACAVSFDIDGAIEWAAGVPLLCEAVRSRATRTCSTPWADGRIDDEVSRSFAGRLVAWCRVLPLCWVPRLVLVLGCYLASSKAQEVLWRPFDHCGLSDSGEMHARMVLRPSWNACAGFVWKLSMFRAGGLCGWGFRWLW